MVVYLHPQLNELRMWGEAFGGEQLPFGVQNVTNFNFNG
jgi:hypothetical protein